LLFLNYKQNLLPGFGSFFYEIVFINTANAKAMSYPNKFFRFFQVKNDIASQLIAFKTALRKIVKMGTIVAAQSIKSTHPYKAPAIGKHTGYIIIGQAA
jgi:hypothetical protein